MNPHTSLATLPARVETFGEEYCDAYWSREFLTEDFIRFSDLGAAPRPVATLHDATGGKLRRSGRYVEVLNPAGFDDELRAAFRTGKTMWGILSLYRDQESPRFSSAEQKVIEDLTAPVAAALRRIVLAEGPAGQPPYQDAPGLLVFDAAGRLQSMNDEAHQWLLELPDSLARASGADVVTTELSKIVARARAIGAGLADGVARARMRSARGRWLVVHASCLKDKAGEIERDAVVIEAASAAEIAPIVIEAYALTPREREITEAIARGEATGEIAGRLHLSPHTVRDYLKAVFEKTGVSSRGELVAKLFSENYPLYDGIVDAVVDTAA